MGSGSWAGWTVLAAGLVALLLAGATGPARAGSGERMVRIVCDAKSNLVTIEPFLLWHEAARPDEAVGLGGAAGQISGVASDYRMEDLAASAVGHDCAMALRKVTVRGEGQGVRVTETIDGGPVSIFSLNLGETAFGPVWPRHATWHPLAGAAPFWVESRAPGQWFECRTVASSDDVMCQAIGLSSSGTEVLTMAPMQSEPMPVEPVGWLSGAAEPVGTAPPGRPPLGLRPGPNGPMLN